MKKRIVSFLLALMLVLSLTVAPVDAQTVASANTQTEETAVVLEMCPCGCGVAMEDLQWKKWDPNEASFVTSGHYYLDGNYAQAEQYNISEGEKYVLDLRGYELTTSDYCRLFLCNGYLAVLDTVGGGKMCSKTSGGGFGGVLFMQTSGSIFELYGGTVTVDEDNKGSRRGGLICLNAGCTFNMYGGTLLGGSSSGTKDEEGGCVATYFSTGAINILGGSVIGGYSPTHGGNIYSRGTTVLKNCTIIGGTADSYGGNIYQSGGSLTVENCVISHGVSNGTVATVTGGGNIAAVSSAAVNIKDSTIHNGYAASYGGNLYFGSGMEQLENVTVTAGVCGEAGGNIRVASNAKPTMIDCTVDGDVSCNGTLTLAGKTKIGLRNYGLKLGTNPAAATELTDGAEIYVAGEGTLTGANGAYFKPALRTLLTETEESITATLAADGETAGYCPHCNAQATWTAYSGEAFTADGHYYLTADQSAYGQKEINNDVVLDLNGYDLTGTARAFFVNGAGLALLDSAGGSTVTMTGVEAAHGGVIRNDGGNLQIFGGKYVLQAGKTVRYGGVLYTSGKATIKGGVFDASAYENTDDLGANVYRVGGASSELSISAGYFIGGRAKNGGNLFVAYNGKVNITGGHFTGGSAAATGGNLYVEGKSAYKNGSLNLSGAALTDGQADTSGGNINITYYLAAKVADSYIAGGSAGSYGGNILANTNSTFVEYENCTIYGGSATRGGNVYSGGLSSRIRFTDCNIMDGTATGNGGNIFVNHGYVEILGGSVTYGTAGDNGGNICSFAGSSNSSGTANYLKLQKGENAPVVLGGKAGDQGGNIYFAGVMHLTDAHIQNGTATTGADLYMAKASLQNVCNLGEGVTGNMTMAVNSGLLGSPVYGNPITGGAAAVLNATICLEGDYGMPQICAHEGALVVAGATVVSGEESTGYATATVAAAACEDGEYVRLYADAALELTRDCAVDLNGYTATVSGDYTLCGMDSAGTGKAVWTAAANTAEAFSAPDGKIYIAITENSETTYHLLDMAVTGAAIRPSVSGIYYTGTWSCDDTLLAQIDSYGVAVDAVSMPNHDFMQDDSTLWTAFAGESLVSGENKTGAIISGILKEDRTATLNDAYGKMPVFATAYVTLKSGTTVVSQGVGYSLYSAMQTLEYCAQEDPVGFAHYIRPAGEFYRTWKENGMGSWDFERISIDPRCPWEYDVVEQAVQEGKMHYYFMSGEWHAYSGGYSEPEKWGDCCLIVFPDGQTMLVDSGVKQYGPILVENLQRMGVTKIDHLVITHPHSDHQYGAFHAENRQGNGVLDLFEIGTVYHRGGYDSKNMEASQLVETVCTERGLNREILEMGDTLQIGEVSIQVLWPQVGTSEKDTTGTNAAAANNASIVMRFDYKNHSSLFTGDIYVEKEADLMELHGELLDVDLLKVPHHGNGVTSNSEAFITAVSPEIAVATGFENISTGTAQRYADAGAKLLGDRTYGYVHVSTDGEEMDYKTSRTSAFTEDISGKRVLFVGDSFLYYGRAVLANTSATEAGRRNDEGYFYQLCKAQGMDVEVINWTYGGTSLSTIMDTHIPKFADYNYDYVIMSGGRNSAATIADYEETMDKYIEVFRGANPNVEMFFLVTSGAHNISVNETFPMDVLNNLDKIEAKGIRVLDWGKMVADIIRGETQVPGATQTYDKYSFVHNATELDGYHPNQLTGYIVSMFVYCAITGESAVGLPYDFWNDSTITSQFDPLVYLNFGYKLGGTNYQDIFNSSADMEGIQKLVDQYIADKSYLDYNFTEVPEN